MTWTIGSILLEIRLGLLIRSKAALWMVFLDGIGDVVGRRSYLRVLKFLCFGFFGPLMTDGWMDFWS